MRLHAISIVIFAVFFACQRSENRYLKRNVKAAEIVGTWTMTPTGVEGLRFANHRLHLNASDHVLVLRSDGSCLYRTFIDPLKTFGADEGYVSSECEWTLGDVGHQALMIRLQGESSQTLGRYFYFDEENGRLLLWQYAADPDAWKYVEFAKQTNNGHATL
jgi:hypothetical protein